jgi:hypothetical protein
MLSWLMWVLAGVLIAVAGHQLVSWADRNI